MPNVMRWSHATAFEQTHIMSSRIGAGSKIFVAGHRGLAGSAIVRVLREQGYKQVITRPHKQLDLTRKRAVSNFFDSTRPDCVVLAAARVGGIVANSTFPADFIRENLEIQ